MDTLEMDYFSTFPGDGCGAYVSGDGCGAYAVLSRFKANSVRLVLD